ncbi:hypothetical protein NL108_004332 [Boleophthalmus pectinirostris]|uniref:complement component C1q receptor-like n=1 Tax=Boleophthalmus pectinirostris TaxID=150288 RepID=UPI00242D4722|nr:complement component C1q receptor-like [Boleophthalmus pectinirostris]KAJ0062694.1 hypothetical protein NL108_004332 [Boleophthalmus pectinirostris]
MLLIFLLMLTFSNAEYETLCTSNACFTLHLDGLSFVEANTNCNNNGGYLMTIRSKEEEDILQTLLSQISLQEKHFKIRIGLKLHRESCVISQEPLKGFKWVSGAEDSEYSNWGREPHSTCHERCVSISYNPMSHSHLKWTDGSCLKPFPYVCMFYFKGMCKALTISGPGQITYTVPFSKESQNYQLKLLPVGTYVDIMCDGQEPFYILCSNAHNKGYTWSKPGPFCQTNRSCAIKNGGCEHVCKQEGKEVTCSCNNSYELNEDGVSCGLKNMCSENTCQHQCIMGETGFTCLCPDGMELSSDQRSCLDIDECASQEVCREGSCVNTEGSYICSCEEGFEMIHGHCKDIDECVTSKCEHTCSNSVGSFSCDCNNGFKLSEDGYSCEDINECLGSICKFECVNTRGSFVCACPSGYQVDRSGVCFPTDVSSGSLPESLSESPSESSVVLDVQENFTESLSSTVELQHESPHTNAPSPDFNDTHNQDPVDTSLATSLSKSFNNRVIICVLGSVIPLVVLVAITVGILAVRCNQVKKEVKKNTATDGYCWVSSGLDPRLEKLYESIPTDDL